MEPASVAGLPGKVHTGFWQGLDALWPKLLPAIKERMVGNKPPQLYITGHSKGGALATLAAVRLSKENIKPTGIYTFAAQRSGNAEFAKNYPFTANHYRYEYADDIVPHLPLSIPFADLLQRVPQIRQRFKLTDYDYTPVGTLKYVNAKGEFVPDPDEQADTRFWSIVDLLRAGRFGKIMLDHLFTCGSGYMKALDKTGICSKDCGDSMALLFKAA
jgi:triacylglycerol lipase